MPLRKFEKKGKWGLKNDSDLTILKPVYDTLFITKRGAIGSKYERDEFDEYEKLTIYALDASGDIIANISKKLDKQGIDHVLEFWQLNDELFSFHYSNWDSLELMGVFDEKGQLIIQPEYDEVKLLSNNFILCLHGEHYEEYDDSGEKNYGDKLFNVSGDKVENESIEEYEDIGDGNFSFITTSGKNFVLNNYLVQRG